MSSAPELSGTGTLNADDHGAALLVTAGIMLGLTVIAIILRLSQRWPWHAQLKSEDFMLVSAAILEIGDVAAVARAVHSGMGRHEDALTASQITKTKQALVASFVLTFVVEAAANLSASTLLSAMYARYKNQTFFHGLRGIIICWAIAGALRTAVALVPGVSPLSRATWIGFGVVSICIQLTLFCYSMYTIWFLQMPFSKKLGCSIYFGLCVPAAVVTVIRLLYTPAQTFEGDFTWRDLYMIAISLIESNLVIISAAYPSMRKFLDKASTGFLVPTQAKSASGAKGSTGGSFPMNSMQSRKSRGEAMLEPPGPVDWRAAVSADQGETKSVASFGSRTIMIEKTFEVHNEEPYGDIEV